MCLLLENFGAFMQVSGVVRIKGRYNNIERNQRLCRLCEDNSIEDKYHVLLCCDLFIDLRVTYLPCKYFTNPTRHKGQGSRTTKIGLKYRRIL